MAKNKSSSKSHVRLEMAHKGEKAALELAKKLGLEAQAKKWIKVWNSVKGEVRLAYDRGGKETALKVADQHGIEHAKVDKWMAKWGEGVGAGAELINSTRQRICFVFDRERTGTIVRKGDEQSEIRLDETGEHRFYPNTWFEETDTPKQKKRRGISAEAKA